MCGVRRGYVDRRDWRRERWAEDLSFCLGEAVMLFLLDGMAWGLMAGRTLF